MYGYNVTISNFYMDGIYGGNRFGYYFYYSYARYYMPAVVKITDPTLYSTYPIGFAERTSVSLNLFDFYNWTDFETNTTTKPAAFSPSYVYDTPVLPGFFVYNEDKVPANPSFYNGTALYETLAFGAPTPYYAPYGVCISLDPAMLPISRRCTQLSNIQASTDGTVPSGQSFGLVNFDIPRTSGEGPATLARITANLYPQYYYHNLLQFDYPIQNLSITTFDGVWGSGSFYIWLFVAAYFQSPDSLQTVQFQRSSDVYQVVVDVYPINDDPILIPVEFNLTANGPISRNVTDLSTDADGYSEFELLVAPLIGTVTFDLGTLTWTYTPFPGYTSLDNLGNESDVFVFAVRDNSTSPCGLPLPAYTVNLTDPVLECPDPQNITCGHCISNRVVVAVYVEEAPPTFSNSRSESESESESRSPSRSHSKSRSESESESHSQSDSRSNSRSNTQTPSQSYSQSRSESASISPQCQFSIGPYYRGSTINQTTGACGYQTNVTALENSVGFQPYIGITLSNFPLSSFAFAYGGTLPRIVYSATCDILVIPSHEISIASGCGSFSVATAVFSPPTSGPVSILFSGPGIFALPDGAPMCIEPEQTCECVACG